MILELRILEGKLSKKLLVIGNGKIGKIVARLMKNFMIVKSYDVLTNSEKNLNTQYLNQTVLQFISQKLKKHFFF